MLAPLAEEQRYRLLCDNPLDVIYRSDPDRLIQWVSSSITRFLEWDPDDLVGRPIEFLIHPDDAERTAAQRAIIRSGVGFDAGNPVASPPIRLLRRSGDYRWTSVIAVPQFGTDGRPTGTVGRLRDIHDLVTATETVKVMKELRQAAFDNLLDPLLVMEPVYDEQGRIIDFSYLEANRAACAYNAMTYTQMIGARLLDINPGNRDSGNFEDLVTVLRTGVPLILDNYAYEQELRGGMRRFYDLRVARAGNVLIYTWRDSTDRREAENDLADREDLYRLVTEGVTDAVVRFDTAGVVTWVSPSLERLIGLPAEAVVGRPGADLIADSDVARAEEFIGTRVVGDSGSAIQLKHADGMKVCVSASSRPFVRHDGSSDGFVTVLRDVTAQVESEERRAHDIGHDPLTGLANRGLAIARIERALDELGGSRRFLALLCIGVDRLTTVNQALSYSAGDSILRTIAARIAAATGDPDRLARVAGDEFVLLLTDLTSPAEAASMAERLCAAARGTVTVDGQAIEPTVSIGVAIGERSSTSEELLRQASLAVRQAKSAGRDRWQFVDHSVAKDAQRRLRIEAQLRDVVRDGLIVPWFQPVVTLADRRVHGFEALARWMVPEVEQIPPDEFLPVAASTGLIVDVDLAILKQAVDLLTVIDVDSVAVNVSPTSLATGTYPEGFERIVSMARVDASRLRLEVTETALLGPSPAIARAMQAIAETGATWYVDDFGMGFSSISHLRDLPVRGLKLDRSFTAGIRNGDRTCIKLAQGLIGLADGLGLDTVAEGIETEFEAGALLGQGWHFGQGWLFGRAAPREELLS
jgi:diguanylate cyclase (GGDEF)-like protein/PAS domain S-box-containing protein